MSNSKIIVHCLVKNEERFVWYAIKSVLPFVDKIMVWDTGSNDNTVTIVNSIKSTKISFKEVGNVDIYTFTDIRNQMIKETPTGYSWLMILDGDEIWTESSIKKVIETIKDKAYLESIVVRTRNLVGDIYHQLPESSGNYHLAGKTGHLNLRFINLKKIKGLHVAKPHGQQGYYDADNRLIQDRDIKLVGFVNVYYHHATHLQRSHTRNDDRNVIKRSIKFKYELGKSIKSRDIPSIFFSQIPKCVPDVTKKASIFFWSISAIITIPKLIKRAILPINEGY